MTKRLLRCSLFALILAAPSSALFAGGHEIWPYGVAQERPPVPTTIEAGAGPLGVA